MTNLFFYVAVVVGFPDLEAAGRLFRKDIVRFELVRLMKIIVVIVKGKE